VWRLESFAHRAQRDDTDGHRADYDTTNHHNADTDANTRVLGRGL